MANLVEVAEELEYVPKDQLVQMAQDPSSRFPSYMVLSEIQRRTQMEKMYNAQRAERPTSTVAEELVGEFASPQGLAGMSAGRLGPQPNDFSRPAMPASPMQMAAGGGRTGYANKGKTEPLNRQPMPFGGDKEYDIMTSLIRDPASNQLISQKEYNQLYPPALPAEKGFFENIADKASRAINRPTQADLIREKYIETLLDGFSEAGEKGEKASMEFILNQPMQRSIRDEFINMHKRKFQVEKKGIGGRVGYQNLGATGNARLQLLTSLGIDPTNLTEEQIQQALMFATKDAPEQKPLPVVDTGVDRPVDLRTVEAAPVDEPGFLERAGSAISDFASDRYYDQEGDFNYGTALLDASLLVPGVGLAGAGIRGLATGARGLAGAIRSGEAARKITSGAKTAGEATVKGAKALGDLGVKSITKPKKIDTAGPKAFDKKLDSTTFGSQGKSAAAELGYVTPKGLSGTSRFGKIAQPRQLSATRSALLGTGIMGAQVLKEMTDEPTQPVVDVTPPPATERGLTAQERADAELQKRMGEIFGEAKEGENTEKRKGLFGKINAYIDQADGLDVAKLGGIIMGAKNMSELGAGITALAGDIQTRRTAEETRDRAQKLEDIKGAYYQAQTEETLADIAAMPATQLNALLERYGAFQKQINEGVEVLSDEELAAFNAQYTALLQKASELQGVETISRADQMRAILEESRI